MDSPRLILISLILFTAVLRGAPQASNPFSGDAAAIGIGRAAFGVYCSSCHGQDGTGGRAPELRSGNFQSGDRDADVFQTISAGVPNTEMPGWSGRMNAEDIWRIVAFLRAGQGEGGPQKSAARKGDPAHGQSLFEGKGGCLNCHAVDGKGNHIGPDLSRAGRSMSAEYVREAVKGSGFPVLRDYRGVTVVTRTGEKITGVEKAADDFSVLMIDFKGKVYSFDRGAVRSVTREPQSLMPAFGKVFSEAEMDDLVAYIGTLKGAAR